MSSDEFNSTVMEYGRHAPFKEDGVGEGEEVMDGYQGARAMGKTPPGGSRNKSFSSDAESESSAYLNMDHGDGVQLTEAEIVQRLSHLERTELSALLDKQVQKAATFYRHRMSQLAPPREDGGTAINFGLCGVEKQLGCGDFEFMRCGNNDEERAVKRPSAASRQTSLEPMGASSLQRPGHVSRYSSLGAANDILLAESTPTLCLRKWPERFSSCTHSLLPILWWFVKFSYDTMHLHDLWGEAR